MNMNELQISESLRAISSQLQNPMGALILLICLDYITGICVAVREKKVSSKIGAKGVAKKIMIFVMVGVSVIIDYLLIGAGPALSSATILFYCSNELISICENAANIGIPLPKKLVECLKSFRKDLQQDEAEKSQSKNE